MSWMCYSLRGHTAHHISAVTRTSAHDPRGKMKTIQPWSRVLSLLVSLFVIVVASAPVEAASATSGRFAKGAALHPQQQNYAVPNRMTSSTGASLIAFGECGEAQSAIHLGNGGFEYFQIVEIPIASATQAQTWIYGGWKPIGPTQQVSLDLPDYYVHRYSLVQGADSTAQGWEIQSAGTAFTHLPSMNIRYWC